MLLVTTAFAAGLHAGIPVRGVPGVGEPAFVTPETGWTASVQGGWIRVFVGATEADGADWYARTLATIQATPPALKMADEAAGDGETLVAFRDGNVAVLVRVSSGAKALADRLRAAIVDDAPPLAAPTLEPSDAGWTVDAPGAVFVSTEGGRGVPFRAGLWKEAPRVVVAWDAWGRPTVLTR